MEQAKKGDTVKVHYTGTLEDGTVFDSSKGQEPLEFKMGGGQIIPGFEQAVEGMTPGESKTVKIPAQDAYGAHNDEMIFEIGRQEFPTDVEPEVGQQFRVHQADGTPLVVTVTDLDEENITLDANHPLAGQDLTFDIQLVEIE